MSPVLLFAMLVLLGCLGLVVHAHETFAELGLLAGLVGPQLMGRVDTSKVTAADTQVRMLKAALDTDLLDDDYDFL